MAIQAQMYPENLGLPLGGGSQDLFVDNSNQNHLNNSFFFNGCGLNEFSFQKHQQQQQELLLQIPYQQQQQYLVEFHNLQQRNHSQNQNQSLPCENGFVFLPSSKNYNNMNSNNNNNGSTSSTITTTTSSDHMPMNLSQSLAAQLEKHRQEIDKYITLQNERLRLALQEQRKQQLATILRKLEAKATVLLKQKDEELVKARNRGMELQECVRKMEVESQAWQRVAAEKEAMVVSLSNTLEQLRDQQQQGCSAYGLDDAESCCDDNDYPCNNKKRNRVGGNDEREDEEQQRETGNNKAMMMMTVCRFCNSRNSCMLLLPCRHLCSCKACEPFIDACPLCKSPKTASIEALFS